MSSTLDSKASPACSTRGLFVRFDQKISVNETGECATQQRANPVNQVIVPMRAGDRWPECPRRIHGRARKRPTKKKVQSPCQTDSQTALLRRAAVHRRSVNCVHEKKRQHRDNK